MIETVNPKAVMQSRLKSCSAISAWYIIVFHLSSTASGHHLLVDSMTQVCHERQSLHAHRKHRYMMPLYVQDLKNRSFEVINRRIFMSVDPVRMT